MLMICIPAWQATTAKAATKRWNWMDDSTGNLRKTKRSQPHTWITSEAKLFWAHPARVTGQAGSISPPARVAWKDATKASSRPSAIAPRRPAISSWK